MKKLLSLGLILTSLLLAGCATTATTTKSDNKNIKIIVNRNKKQIERIAKVFFGKKAGIKVTFAGSIPESIKVPAGKMSIWSCLYIKKYGYVEHGYYGSCGLTHYLKYGYIKKNKIIKSESPFKYGVIRYVKFENLHGSDLVPLKTKLSYRIGLIRFLKALGFSINFLNPHHVVALFDPDHMLKKIASARVNVNRKITRTAIIKALSPFIIVNSITLKTGKQAFKKERKYHNNQWGTWLYIESNIDNGGNISEGLSGSGCFFSVPNSIIKKLNLRGH